MGIYFRYVQFCNKELLRPPNSRSPWNVLKFVAVVVVFAAAAALAPPKPLSKHHNIKEEEEVVRNFSGRRARFPGFRGPPREKSEFSVDLFPSRIRGTNLAVKNWGRKICVRTTQGKCDRRKGKSASVYSGNSLIQCRSLLLTYFISHFLFICV